MTVQELKERKQALGLTNERVAELSGLPLSTIQKIFAGITRAPRESTLCAIERALLKAEIDRKTEYVHEFRDQASFVQETKLLDLYDNYWNTLDTFEPRPADVKEPVRPQGEFTLLDYFAIPPDRRVELIDGVIYDMATPSRRHQAVISALMYYITHYIISHDLPCTPFAAPLDVRLDRDDRTMLQPDILVLCSHEEDPTDSEEEDTGNEGVKSAADRTSPSDGDAPADEILEQFRGPMDRAALEKFISLPVMNQRQQNDGQKDSNYRYINGAPDFVVEILSPTTKKKDTQLKLQKYMNAGVQEYWMIDPEREYVIVQGQDEKIINFYTFNEQVPVALTDGELVIDFREIRSLVERFLRNSRR